MTDWGAIFHPPTTPVPETFVRGTATYLALFALARLTRQREAGELGTTDLLGVVLVGEAAASGLQGDASSVADRVLLVATIQFWSFPIDAVAHWWPRLSTVLAGRHQELIKDGKLNCAVTRREIITREEVLSQLRLHRIDDVGLVRRAYVEPNGTVSVLHHHDGGTGSAEPTDAR